MKNFLQSAEEQLIFNKDVDSIITELSDHVVTKKEFFESIGYDKEASAEKANEAMGSGEIIGQRLDMIHRSNTKIKRLMVAGVLIINIALHFLEIPEGNNIFLIPFLMALLALISKFLFTAVAIRLKSIPISIALIICSFFHLFTQDYPLVYPLCNLIVRNLSGNEYFFFYLYIPAAITAFIVLLILIPNVMNIHHCNQIKKLKNTRKQNKIASALRNVCVIAAIASFVLSVPFYAMNEHINEEQAAVREELFSFALGTVNKFNNDKWDELAEYLRNSEYDFYQYSSSYSIDDGEEIYEYDSYTCNIGNWQLSFNYKEENPNKYSADLHFNNIDNYSQAYLYTTAEKIGELIEEIGNPEVGPGNAMGHSAQVISNNMFGFDFRDFSIDKSEDGIVYKYQWQETHSYFDCKRVYEFYCDTDDICYYYELY